MTDEELDAKLEAVQAAMNTEHDKKKLPELTRVFQAVIEEQVSRDLIAQSVGGLAWAIRKSQGEIITFRSPEGFTAISKRKPKLRASGETKAEARKAVRDLIREHVERLFGEKFKEIRNS